MLADLGGDALVALTDRAGVGGAERADRDEAVNDQRSDRRRSDEEDEACGDASHRLARARTAEGFQRHSVPMTSGLESEGTSKVPRTARAASGHAMKIAGGSS